MAPALCFHRDITISTFFHCRVEIANTVDRIGLKNSIVPAGLAAFAGRLSRHCASACSGLGSCRAAFNRPCGAELTFRAIAIPVVNVGSAAAALCLVDSAPNSCGLGCLPPTYCAYGAEALGAGLAAVSSRVSFVGAQTGVSVPPKPFSYLVFKERVTPWPAGRATGTNASEAL
jgi:hypothetical protein